MNDRQIQDFEYWKDHYVEIDPSNEVNMLEAYANYSNAVKVGVCGNPSPPLKPKTFARLLRTYFKGTHDTASVNFYYRDGSKIQGINLLENN